MNQIPTHDSLVSSFRETAPPAILSLGLPRDFNLANFLLDKACNEWSSKVALVCGQHVVTFQALNDLANQAANLLAANRVDIENRVVILADDSIYTAAAVLGALKIGAVPVPVPKSFAPHELRYLLADSRARVAIVDADQLDTVRHLAGHYPEVILTTNPQSDLQAKSWVEELQYASTERPEVGTTGDDSAFWIYTSGETSFPKAVIHMHHAPLYCCDTYAKNVLGLNTEDVILSVPGMTTSQGLLNSLFFPLWSGATGIICPAGLEAQQYVDLINTHKPTIFFASPQIYEDMMQLLAHISHKPLASLRMCVSSGQTLSAALSTKWKTICDLDIISGLSCTETMHIFISNKDGQVRPGSLGKVVEGYEVRLEDNHGCLVSTGKIGNLLVRGGSLSSGYWNRRRKTCTTMLGLWLSVGDKCSQDEDGYYYFAGRTDDLINVGDQLVSPYEIEQHLQELPEAKEVAVVGAADDTGTTRLRAFIVLRPKYEASAALAAQMRAAANVGQPLTHQIKWIDFVPSLPRSTTGRLQRYKLR